ncbi:MAG: manganese efflux pump MntP family protein [Bacteroidales bacterium]|nr:manganese efflux pump MntP family protein [Bacteroidales bacterium]
MFITTAILLALALCVDSFVVSTTSAFKTKMTYRRGMLMSLVFAVFQGSLPLLGALLGTAFRAWMESIDHWVAFALLLLVGGKMIFDAIRPPRDGGSLDLSKFMVFCVLGIATSIDAFVVGISMGLDYTMSQVFIIVGIIAATTFVVSMAGVFLGKRNVPVPERLASVLAGVVLIGLGVYTLIEHQVFA